MLMAVSVTFSATISQTAMAVASSGQGFLQIDLATPGVRFDWRP
jgi:hypothetical protein